MFQAALALLGIGKSYLEGRQKIKLNEQEATSRARIKRLDNAASWEQIVAQKSSRFLRWVCAAHLFAGLDFTIYLAVKGDPNPGMIFDAFAVVPDWYTGLLATMFAWAFGSEPVKAAGGRLVEAWGKRQSAANKSGGAL
jgi:hypothetical protein